VQFRIPATRQEGGGSILDTGTGIKSQQGDEEIREKKNNFSRWLGGNREGNHSTRLLALTAVTRFEMPFRPD
jgi:hypothetical protein